MSLEATRPVRRTSLHGRHVAAGARMVPFAGWEMPVRYGSIVEEHRAVRKRAGIFDVSHMGEIVLTGRAREAEADRLTTARVSGAEAGDVQYALLLNERGGIVDDILVYKMESSVLLVVNAVNREKDFRWIASHLGGGAKAVDKSLATSQMAVQGPESRRVIRRVAGGEAADLGYYRAVRAEIAGAACVVSRTGYTGELGFEIYAPWEAGPAVWDAIVAPAGGERVVPVGLGARDSLRLEMRYCLYGHEIDEETSPVEAGLGWAVRKKKGDFVGKEAYVAARKAERRRRLVAFRLGPREIPRPAYAIVHDGREAGAVTSGGFSPSLGIGIALGYVDAAAAAATDGFAVLIRGRPAPATRQKGSFVPSSAKEEGEEQA